MTLTASASTLVQPITTTGNSEFHRLYHQWYRKLHYPNRVPGVSAEVLLFVMRACIVPTLHMERLISSLSDHLIHHQLISSLNQFSTWSELNTPLKTSTWKPTLIFSILDLNEEFASFDEEAVAKNTVKSSLVRPRPLGYETHLDDATNIVL